MFQLLQKIKDTFIPETRLDVPYSNTSNRAKTNWEDEFSRRVKAHAQQNEIITKDFLLNVKKQPTFQSALESAKSILEFGCGSGEMLNRISKEFPNAINCLGIDISETAIYYANEKYKSPRLEYRYYDALQENGLGALGHFDLIICSNTLEHFKNPHEVIQKMQETEARHFVFLVPYLQPCTDGYDSEGGMGHVYTFDDLTFSRYRVLSKFTFRTAGWQHSSRGEVPTQLAILIENIK